MKKILGLFVAFCRLFGFNNAKNKNVNMFVVTEKLVPWIVLKCYEKDNYLITDKQAKNLAYIILKQAEKMNAIDIIPRVYLGV